MRVVSIRDSMANRFTERQMTRLWIATSCCCFRAIRLNLPTIALALVLLVPAVACGVVALPIEHVSSRLGCAPAAAGAIFRYFDTGHGRLWDDCVVADLATAMNTVAGWTRSRYYHAGIIDVAHDRGCTATVDFTQWPSIEGMAADIAAGMPVTILADTSGDGVSDHYMVVVAVDQDDDRYGYLDRSGELVWSPLYGLGEGVPGVMFAWAVDIACPDDDGPPPGWCPTVAWPGQPGSDLAPAVARSVAILLLR